MITFFFFHLLLSPVPPEEVLHAVAPDWLPLPGPEPFPAGGTLTVYKFSRG